MGEIRGGEGPVLSSAAVKIGLGRSFQRAAKHHLGRPSDPTAWSGEAHSVLQGEYPPKGEMQMLFRENPRTVVALRSAGFSDTQIFEVLDQL
jgi:hypothetical protein